MKLDILKTRIGNADYVVDPDAVAEAIVRHALAARRELRQAVGPLDGPDAHGNGPAFETG